MTSGASDLSGRLEPKLVTVLREGLTRRQVAVDVLAGVIVGIVALPLAIAFGIASGVTPAQGLVTAIVAGFLISALGGSRVQIGGPTGAFVVLVYAVVQRHGIDGMALATLIAGLLLVLMGLARLGTVIQFVPYPVTCRRRGCATSRWTSPVSRARAASTRRWRRSAGTSSPGGSRTRRCPSAASSHPAPS